MSNLSIFFDPEELNISWKTRRIPLNFVNFKEDKISTVDNLKFKEKNRNRIYISPFETDVPNYNDNSLQRIKIKDEEKALHIEREIWTLLQKFKKEKDRSYPAKDAIEEKINDLNMYEFTPKVFEEFKKIHKAVQNHFYIYFKETNYNIVKHTNNRNTKVPNLQNTKTRKAKNKVNNKQTLRESKKISTDPFFIITQNIRSIKKQIWKCGAPQLPSLKSQLGKLYGELRNINDETHAIIQEALLNEINKLRKNIDYRLNQQNKINDGKTEISKKQLKQTKNSNVEEFDLKKYMEERANNFRDNTIGSIIQIKGKDK